MKKNIDEKMLNCSSTNEKPLNVFMFDIPNTHKYIDENADDFLEALAGTN